MEGTRYNTGKVKWSLVDFKSLEPMVRVLEFGAQKYAPENWKKGLKVTEIMESCLRHIFSFLEGQDNDTESDISHLGHAMCNLMFAQWMVENRKDLDNRKSKEGYIQKEFHKK